MSKSPDSQITGIDTVDAARKLLRAFFRIAEAWQLGPGEQEALLGVNKPTCSRWRDELVTSALGDDTVGRLGYILNIYAALQILCRGRRGQTSGYARPTQHRRSTASQRSSECCGDEWRT